MMTRMRFAAVGAAAALALVLSAGPAAAPPDPWTVIGNAPSVWNLGDRAPDVWTLPWKGQERAGAIRAKAQSIGR